MFEVFDLLHNDTKDLAHINFRDQNVGLIQVGMTFGSSKNGCRQTYITLGKWNGNNISVWHFPPSSYFVLYHHC